MNVLLVDDDAFLRDMYQTKFIQEGATVTAVSSGSEALQAIKEDTFSVIITDMIMPGMSGLDFITQAQIAIPKGDVKYIILSNQGEQSDKDAADKLGVDGYIIKAELIPSEVVKKVFEIVSK